MKPAIGFICTQIAVAISAVLGWRMAQAEGIWLSPEQFLSVRFSSSIAAMRDAIREQLQATFPRARSDVGPIDWRNAQFGLARTGRAEMTFEAPVWKPIGSPAPAVSTIVAAEAYFNCTGLADSRRLTESDVRTTEAENTRTRAASRTDDVKAQLNLTYTPLTATVGKASLTGGLGGSAAAEWKRTVQASEQWMQRTREHRVQTNMAEQNVSIPPRTMRFYQYVHQLTSQRFEVVGDVIIDVPIAAVFTRPAYLGKWRLGGRPQIPPKQFRFNLGRWSYYYPAPERTIRQRAIATIHRAQVILGPTDATFPTIADCVSARDDFTSLRTDLTALVRRADRLSRRGR